MIKATESKIDSTSDTKFNWEKNCKHFRIIQLPKYFTNYDVVLFTHPTLARNSIFICNFLCARHRENQLQVCSNLLDQIKELLSHFILSQLNKETPDAGIEETPKVSHTGFSGVYNNPHPVG